MFKEAESRPDKIERTSNNVQVRKKQQHRRRACDLLASLKRFYWPNTRIPMCLNRPDMTKFNRRFHGKAGDGHLHTHHIWTPEVLPFHMTPSNLLCRGGESNPIYWPF